MKPKMTCYVCGRTISMAGRKTRMCGYNPIAGESIGKPMHWKCAKVPTEPKPAAKPTPGPWTAKQIGPRDVMDNQTTTIHAGDNTKWSIAEVTHARDAALIASAPTMLHALHDAKLYLETDFDTRRKNGGTVAAFEQQILDSVLYAIKQAEGGAL